MRKLEPQTKKTGKPRSGATGKMEIRVADADRDLIARAAALRGATVSEYVRLIVIAQAKKDLGLS